MVVVNYDKQNYIKNNGGCVCVEYTDTSDILHNRATAGWRFGH